MARATRIQSVLFGPLAFYPPSINALTVLAQGGGTVASLSTGSDDSELMLPAAVAIEVVPRREPTGSAGTFRFFARFCRALAQRLREDPPDVLLLYDDAAMLAWRVVRPFVAVRPRLWFHSHDITEEYELGRFNLAGLARRAQRAIFPELAVFTLPARERLRFFPDAAPATMQRIVPNYPSRALYEPRRGPIRARERGEGLRLLYQGNVSDDHGLLELIHFLGRHPEYSLTMIGRCPDAFRLQVDEAIRASGSSGRVELLPPVPYDRLVPFAASRFDVGVAVNVPQGKIVYMTGATASNKLYEYAALGLPTLYFDAPHYREYLDRFPWAFAVDLSDASLAGALRAIEAHGPALAAAAREGFMRDFNFERVFDAVRQQVMTGAGDAPADRC